MLTWSVAVLGLRRAIVRVLLLRWRLLQTGQNVQVGTTTMDGDEERTEWYPFDWGDGYP